MRNIRTNIKFGTKIHFMGIGGSGISGVANLAEKIGYQVTGCDLEKNTAYAKNIFQGHSVKHLKDIDLVVASPAVFYQNSNHPEFVEAKKAGVLMTWQEFTGRFLLKGKKVISVCGTHGKSTTTAMVGKLLEDAGFDPTVLLGAKVTKWDGNSRYGKGDYFVIEADEFFDNFLNYHPQIIILNNIEFDHPDYFSSEKKVFESFKKFVGNLVGAKILIANKDSSGVRRLLRLAKQNDLKKILYSVKEDKIDFKLEIPGRHNIQNALGVVKLGEVLGIDRKVINKSLESFTGIGRRLELLNESGKIKVYDDYAHHPTAIAATLEALRSLYPKNRILAIVEAHGYKRTKALLFLYKGVFKDADYVLIGPIYKARDSKTYGMTPDSIAKASGHRNIHGYDSFKKIKDVIFKKAKKGDVILIMGAGDSYIWVRELSNLFAGVSFRDLTTFKIGGKIKHYREVSNRRDLVNTISFATVNKLPIFIIGAGSDILVSDKDFDGVVIKYASNSISFLKNGIVEAQAGVIWDDLVKGAVKNNLQGIECLSGIPGTVGAAPIQNIGAYGQELKDTFVGLEAYDIEKKKFRTFDKTDCKFAYRESIFKRPDYWQKYVIVSVKFSLNLNSKPSLEYVSLKNYLAEKSGLKPSLFDVRNAVLKIRAGKFEDPKKVGNAGSFFKNPIINKGEFKRLKNDFSDMPLFENKDKTYKCFAGWFIEKTGWKGKKYKNAQVSPNHALVLINPEGRARATDIIELAERITADVYAKFKIKLEKEVQLINF